MDNLYKKIRIDNEIYTVVAEHGKGITLISDDKVRTEYFKTEYDLTEFIRKRVVK